MTIPLVQVAVTLVDPGGNPIAGAQVTATLSAPIVYQGVVAPVMESAATDVNGQCTLNLVPSAIGVSPQTYSFVIWPPYAPEPTIFDGITVPNVASITLQELLGGTGPVTTINYMTPTQYMTGSLFMGVYVPPVSIHYMNAAQPMTGSLYIG